MGALVPAETTPVWHGVTHMTTARSRMAAVTILAFSSLLGACGGSTSSDGGAGGGVGGSGAGFTCSYAGKSYHPGEQFPAIDGCGICSCKATGETPCSGGCPGTCTVNGQVYQQGETFPTGDGCNVCTCEPGGQVACSGGSCVSGCDYEGQYYEPKQSFPAKDGCNSCTCQPDGQVACTQIDCLALCVYGGTQYQPGQSFPALDGCNTCSCENGGVACTKLACACDPGKEWWRSYIATDPQKCLLADYACEPSTTPFSNACGCGCEEDASCPPFIDCMPPSDCSALVKKCPFSGVAN
jgi:hypothetical protein